MAINSDLDVDEVTGPQYDEDLHLLNENSEGDVAASTEEEDEPEVTSEEETKESEEEIKDNKKPDIPFDRPSLSEIKAKYPNFFKDFPSMRDSFYRETEFTRLFPTVEDAKEAFEDNEAFISMREDVLSGKSERLIDAIQTQRGNELHTFSTDFLTTLYKKDKDTYINVVSPLYENVIRGMYSSENEDDRNAALRMSKYLFGTTEIAEGKQTTFKKVEAPKINTEDDKLAYNKHLGEVGASFNMMVSRIIEKDLDPDLKPFLKKSIINEIVNEVHNQLRQDESHKAVMDARWKRAKIAGYSEEEKAKIISAGLARAKSLIPSIRNKVVKDALGTTEKHNKSRESEISKTINNKKEINSGYQGSGKGSSSTKIDYNKMSDLDILNN